MRQSTTDLCLPSQALADAFDALPRYRQEELCNHAAEAASRGACFLCKWIRDKVRYEDFPKPARKAHLMLCCDGSGASTHDSSLPAGG